MISIASTMDPDAPHELGRGPLARAALIRAGVQVFGENSLASATTREIAQLAGQNISAIAYYFGNKEGLYFAVAHHICDTLVERLGPLLDEIEARFTVEEFAAAEEAMAAGEASNIDFDALGRLCVG
jgi:AcrR family transcriptional regulator